MSTLAFERFAAPSSRRAARTRERARGRAFDELAGRAIWCASALGAGRAPAEAMRACLGRARPDDVAVGLLEITPGEPLRSLAERLEAMLRGVEAEDAMLGRDDRRLCDEGIADAETQFAGTVRPGDVVLLNDSVTALLAGAVREQGAHAVWYVAMPPAGRRASAAEARQFLDRYIAPLDAYLISRRRSLGRGRTVDRIEALMPSARVVSAKESEASRDDLGWPAALADVVHADREETVGGTLHARPAVAAR